MNNKLVDVVMVVFVVIMSFTLLVISAWGITEIF